MKKKLLLIVLLANICFGSQSIAQYNVIKMDGLGLLAGGRINLSYERSLTKQFSLGITLETGMYSYSETSMVGTYNFYRLYGLYGIGFIPELRYYPFTNNKPAPLGFFVGSAFRYSWLFERYAPQEFYSYGNGYHLGISSGYKLNYKRFIAEGLIGYGYGFLTGFDEVERNEQDAYYLDNSAYHLKVMKHFPRIEVSIGYVFPRVKTEKSKKNHG